MSEPTFSSLDEIQELTIPELRALIERIKDLLVHKIHQNIRDAQEIVDEYEEK